MIVKNILLYIVLISTLLGIFMQTPQKASAVNDYWTAVSDLGMRPGVEASQMGVMASGNWNGRACFSTWGNPDGANNGPTAPGKTTCGLENSTPTTFNGATNLYGAGLPESPIPEMLTTPPIIYGNRPLAGYAQWYPDPSTGSGYTGIIRSDSTGYRRGYAPAELLQNAPRWRIAPRIFSAVVYNNDLYFGTFSHGVFGGVESLGFQIWRHRGSVYNPNEDASWAPNSPAWTKIISGGLGDRKNEAIFNMFTYNGRIFASVFNVNVNRTETKILYSSNGNTGTWNWLTIPGANNQSGQYFGSFVSGHVEFNNALYINVSGDGIYKITNPTSTPSSWSWSGKITGSNPGGGVINSLTTTNIDDQPVITGIVGNKVFKSSDGDVFKQSSDDLKSCNYFSCSSLTSLSVSGRSLFAGYGSWDFNRTSGNMFSYSQLGHLARIWCLGCVSTSRLTIDLPPTVAFQPNEMTLPGNNRTDYYIFLPSNLPAFPEPRFACDNISHPPNNPCLFDGLITVTERTYASPLNQAYTVTINQFKKRLEPYDIKLNFNGRILFKATIDQLESYLVTNYGTPGTYPETILLADANCAPKTVATYSHICFRTNFRARDIISGKNISLAPVSEVIPTKGIKVKGNVRAPGTLKDFRISDNALAVGGNILSEGGSSLQGYSTTRLAWGDINDTNSIAFKLNRSFTTGQQKGTAISRFTSPLDTYTNNTWYLNSRDSDPRVDLKNTSSSPPEGKLWFYPNNLRLSPSTELKFTGNGTLVVAGDLIIDGKIACDSTNLNSTRLGIIVSGKIVITNRASQMDCGAYVALGGNIEMQSTGSATVKGIFVARGSIVLPDLNYLTGTYEIEYDSVFAKNPTVLFKEILLTIGYTTS